MKAKYESSNRSIKTWAMEDRPREKLLEKGIQSLSDSELLAILLGSGQRNESAVQLAQRVLQSVDYNLHRLAKQSVNDLCRHKGIGTVKALSIIATMELGRRRKASEVFESNSITNSASAAALFQSKLSDLPHEEFWVLLLNRANRVLSVERISQGGIQATVIDIRILMKRALDQLASGMIVCHNHPSGALKPSDQDMRITRKMQDACLLLEISFLDHLIVSDRGYYSFADEGKLVHG